MVVRRPIGSSSSLLTDLMDSCAAMLSYWICTNCRSTLPFLYDSLLLTRNRAEDPTQHNLLPKSILAQQGIIYAGPGRFLIRYTFAPRGPHTAPPHSTDHPKPEHVPRREEYKGGHRGHQPKKGTGVRHRKGCLAYHRVLSRNPHAYA